MKTINSNPSQLSIFKNQIRKPSKALYISCIVFFLVGSTYSCKNEKEDNTEGLNNSKDVSQKYIIEVAKNINQLSEERKASREKIENELKATSTYQELVTNQTLSIDNLPLLTAINYGLRSIHEPKGNTGDMFVNPKLITKIEKSNNGKDKLNFMVKALSLLNPKNGGLTKELVEVFRNYKKKYGLYGESGRVYMVDGKTESLPSSFNISSICYLINSSNKNLNAIYEANKAGIDEWLSNDRLYIYSYMATKKGYLNYVKEVNPNGPYTLKVDYELTANQLYKAYDTNEIAADNKYKNKKLAVTGKIHDISEVFGNIAVDIKSGDGIGWTTIRCTMQDRDEVSKLRKGQKVTITGTCKGLTLNLAINLEDCKIWQE